MGDKKKQMTLIGPSPCRQKIDVKKYFHPKAVYEWQHIEGKVKVKVAPSCPTLCDPMNYTVHGIPQARILEWVAFPFSRGSSQSMSPALQADSLPAEAPGKPKNTGMGSLSLLQQIFTTQESNWGLLHCRWILYQLSYQGSPKVGDKCCEDTGACYFMKMCRCFVVQGMPQYLFQVKVKLFHLTIN